jgi:hypothetical protein
VAAGAQAARIMVAITSRKAIFLNIIFSPVRIDLFNRAKVLVRYNQDTRRCLSLRGMFAGKCLLGDANQEAGTSLFLFAFMYSLFLHLLSVLFTKEKN